MHKDAGFTLIELLVSVAIFSFASAAFSTSSLQMNYHIKKTTKQSKALLAAQKVLDNYRSLLPTSLPSTYTEDPALNVVIDGEIYSVVIIHCANTTYCPPTASIETRHLTAEIYNNNKFLYEVETVFTEFL